MHIRARSGLLKARTHTHTPNKQHQTTRYAREPARSRRPSRSVEGSNRATNASPDVPATTPASEAAAAADETEPIVAMSITAHTHHRAQHNTTCIEYEIS